MKRERRAAARLAGWEAAMNKLDAIIHCETPALDELLSDEERDIAKTACAAFLDRCAATLVYNKPRGT